MLANLPAPETGVPDDRALAGLLLLETALESSGDEQQLTAAASRFLEKLPGVARCAVHLDRAPQAEAVAPRPAGTVTLPLVSGGRDCGSVCVELSDPQRWAPYAPFVSSACGLLALHIENRRNARRLRELEQQSMQLQFALRGAELGAWDWNVRTGEVRYDQRWAEMLGYRLEDLEPCYQTWEQLLHPDDRQPALQSLAAHLEGKTPGFEVEFRLRTCAGDWLWVLAKGGVIERDAAGGPLRVCGTHLDISARKRTEQALRDREATYRALVAGIPDVVMSFDREGRHLFVSGNVSEVVPISAAQFIGRTHRELGFSEPLCTYFEDCLRQVFDSGKPLETEFPLESNDRPTRIFNWRLTPARDEKGVIQSVVSISRDITEHRRLEQDYQTLFREMLDAFSRHEVICDEQGKPVDYRFLAVNPAFERMTGLKAEQIVGKTVREILPGVEPYWIQIFGNVALTGEPAFFENRAEDLNGDYEGRCFRPAPNQFACLFTDVTRRKQAEAEREKLLAQLSQAQKMESIGRLAGGVAHDFNNLLTVINGYSQLALTQLAPDDPLHASLGEIHKAGERAAGLTRQLLAFSRKQVLQPRHLDLNHIVEEMRRMLERLVGESIEVRIHLHPGRATVYADPHQLEQVIMNLAVNSRDAMPDGGTLLIETGCMNLDDSRPGSKPEIPPGRYVVLAVTDSGMGMDEVTRQRIFEPFFTTKGTGKGTGLGLATVQGIVAQSGGFILVESEPERGATFRIYLPSPAETELSRPESRQPVPVVGGKETVLVIEDQAEVRDFAVKVLRKYGYRVIEAAGAADAVALCERESIHLLLTDVVMPSLSGREIANRLHKIRPALKVLFMSGYTDDVTAHYGMLEEGVEFIQKPFSPEELAGKVRAVLGPPQRSARVLVADRDPGVRGFLNAVLRRGGYDVVEAPGDLQTLRWAPDGPLDLVVAELTAASPEAVEAIRTLRRELPATGIIALSGGLEDQFLTAVRAAGADAVLAKPVSARALLAEVAGVLKSPSA